MSESGEERLASIIRGYWLDRGYAIKTWLETAPNGMGACVRSNLYRGLPPGWRRPSNIRLTSTPSRSERAG